MNVLVASNEEEEGVGSLRPRMRRGTKIRDAEENVTLTNTSENSSTMIRLK